MRFQASASACEFYNNDYNNFPDYYVDFLKNYFIAQIDAFEHGELVSGGVIDYCYSCYHYSTTTPATITTPTTTTATTTTTTSASTATTPATTLASIATLLLLLQGAGWMMWTMKTEDHCAPEWDFMLLLDIGVVPENLCERQRYCTFSDGA